MALTTRHKKYIKKNYRTQSLATIAASLNLSPEEVEKYLKKLGKVVHKNNSSSNPAIQSPSLKDFCFKTFFIENKLYLLLVLLLGVAAYVNSLGNDFVSDDIAGIAQNPNLNKVSYLISTAPLIFQNVIYFFVDSLFGKSAFAFRFFNNFIFHLGVIAATYLLVYLLENKRVAFFSSVLVAVHPLLSEAVSWISGGIYIQYAFFLILGLSFWILASQRKQYLWMALASFLLGVMVSEKAIVFPLLILGLQWFKGIKVSINKKVFLFAIPIVLLDGMYISRVPGRLAILRDSYYNNAQILNPLYQIPVAISSYIELIVWPDKLTLYHSEMTFSFIAFIAKAVVFLFFTALLVYSYRKRKNFFFWLWFFLVPLIPTLTPFGISWIVAERYVYLSALGIFVCLGLLVNQYYSRKNWDNTVTFIFSLLICALLVRTVIRNTDWKNQDTLWIAAARTSPSSPNNHNNLGDMHGRHGNYEKAIEEFKLAIALKPNYADAYHNLGNTYVQVRQNDLAIESYQKALSINPNIWQSHRNLAGIYFEDKNYEKALEHMQQAIRISPNNATLYTLLGTVYLTMGDTEQAASAFRQALTMNPQDEQAKKSLLQLSQ